MLLQRKRLREEEEGSGNGAGAGAGVGSRCLSGLLKEAAPQFREEMKEMPWQRMSTEAAAVRVGGTGTYSTRSAGLSASGGAGLADAPGEKLMVKKHLKTQL